MQNKSTTLKKSDIKNSKKINNNTKQILTDKTISGNKDKRFILKTKTWIENAEGELLFGKGKTELLEFINQTGSLLKASKLMGINYKKAWTHLQILQKDSGGNLVITKQGRSKESGTKLTPKALELMKNYLILQKDIENFANKRFKELFLERKE